MSEENNSVAIIPSECFRWQPRVQFIESFRTQAAALNFAFQHGYNLIVERNQGPSPLFDVLEDPDGVCTSGLNLELLKTEDVLVEQPHSGWTMLMVLTLWNLTKRLAALGARLYVHAMVPLSRRAAAVAGVYLRKMVPLSRRAAAVAGIYLRKMVPLSHRAAAVAGVYLRKMVPLSRRAAAVASVYLRTMVPLSRRAATVAGTYLRQMVPISRRIASRCWWSDTALAFRRTWHRHSHGTVLDLAKRFAAVGSLYLRQIAPLSRRAATAAGAHLREIVPIYRRTAAFANLYFREVVPMLCNSAAKCWSDSKGDSQRHTWAVAATQQSNSSQLH